jgi:hypothetical protein
LSIELDNTFVVWSGKVTLTGAGTLTMSQLSGVGAFQNFTDGNARSWPAAQAVQ